VIKTMVSKIHIVQAPKSSKLPNPKAEAAKAKTGKQHGEKMAVRKSPAVPNLSKLPVNFIKVMFELKC
jgi:hypothetical protein